MSSADKSSAVLQGATPTPPEIKPAPSLRMPVRATIKARLWLCIDVPALPLEALARQEHIVARAVFEDEQGIRRVLLANQKATVAGIVAGLSVNAALSLLPDLRLEMRNPLQEEQALMRLASWAERFTSFVSIEPPRTLLLEIAGSLRLFAGVETLRQRIVEGCKEQGFSANLSIAPTPLASLWFAKAGREVCIDDRSSLNRPLSTLPLHCLDWPASVIESLGGMGITCVGDCLRLPRDGFTRRFGAARLLQLDRALGRMPDPRVSYRSAEQFCTLLDLEEEQKDSQLLLRVCRQLLLQLERFLLIRQMQVQRVQFSFFHLRAAATDLVLGSGQAGRSAEHWLELLNLKFDRMTLPEPVISIRLRGGPGQRVSVVTDKLLFDPAAKSRDGSIACLVERLNARMGNSCVHRLATVAEHRPQYAWRSVSVSDAASRCTRAVGFWHEEPLQMLMRRPLWMLKEPECLASEHDRPLYQGPLTLVEGPERLESGWWDDDGIARDYFIALTVKGMYLWVYQDRKQKKALWYLHGIFG